MPTFRDDIHRGIRVPLIKTDDLDDFSVTEEKIADGAVTNRKLNTDLIFGGDIIKGEGSICERRDCGLWKAGRKYYNGFDSTGKIYRQDLVWYGDILWQCNTTHTAAKAPRWNNTDWTALFGGERWKIDFLSSCGLAVNISSNTNIYLEARVWQSNIQLFCEAQQSKDFDIGVTEVWWTRESKKPDGTAIDASGDTAWNATHRQGTWKDGLVLTLGRSDFPSVWMAGDNIGFRVHAIVGASEKTGVFNLN